MDCDKKLKKAMFKKAFTKIFLILLLLSCFVLIFLYLWTSSSISFKERYIRPDNFLPLFNTRTQKNKYDFDENIVVIYNRVPKTASTSFVNLTYDLCKTNRFHVLHINITGNNHVLSLPNQMKFVRNITGWTEMKPAFYHGHLAFLDFSKFGMPEKPLYINIIRQPLDRLVSYYYFLRYGDDYRPHLVRHRSGDTMSFDECVKLKKPDCDPKNMWLQIPFFCGHHQECFVPGSRWALEQAKKNLVNEYFLVGMTEDLGDFIEMLELSLPRIFQGAVDHFAKSNKSHLRKTKGKTDPLPVTEAKIKESKIWQMENELYYFARDHFYFLKNKHMSGNKKQDFTYEKIKPSPILNKS